MPKTNQWIHNASHNSNNNIWHSKPQYINGHASADNSFTLTREPEHARLNRRGVQSDTASLLTRSSWTSRRTEKKSANRCCLILMFIIGAIIIAAAIATLVYFLLSASLNKSKNHGRKEADVSVRLLNKTYTPEMADNKSAQFRSVAVPFCDEMDAYFQKNYSKSYNGCRVVELRDVANRKDCVCITKGGHGLVEVLFELGFEGDVKNVTKKKILDVIWGNTKQIPFDNVVYFMIKDYLIDIHVAWQASNNGVNADISIPVYNLTYTKDLEYQNSSRYKYHADLFCNDIDTFFRSSPLRNRYVGCAVSKYNMFPLGVDIDLKFRGNETRSLQKDLIKIIMGSAKSVPFANMNLKLIGDLLVTPWDIDLTLKPGTPRTTTPEPTTPPTTTIVTSTDPGIEVDKVFKLYNFTWGPGLQFPLSPQFKGISQPFCKDLERLHLLGKNGQHFFTCKVYGFGEEPDSVIFSITYKGIQPDHDTILDVITKGAPKLVERGKTMYQVGNLFLIVNETYIVPTSTLPPLTTSVHLTTYIPVENDNSSIDTPFLEPSSMNSVTENMVSSSDLVSSTTPTISSSISENSYDITLVSDLTSMETSELFNMETSSMVDSKSMAYDMETSISDMETTENSIVSNTEFMESSMTFSTETLHDSVSSMKPLDSSIISNMETLTSNMELISSVSNVTYSTDTLMSSIKPSLSSSTVITSPSPPIFTGVTQVDLFYRLFDFTYHPDLANKDSIRYRILKDETCRQLENFMKMNRALDYIYQDCDIQINEDSTATFRLIYSTLHHQSLANVSMTTLEKFAPHLEVWPYKLIRVSSLYPIIGSGTGTETVVTIIEPLMSTTKFPEATQIPTLPPKYDTTVARSTYRLYNFTYRPELRNLSSLYFENLEQNFCADMDRFYKSSFLFLTYQHCQINRFGDNPKDVEFDLYFYAEISDRLKNEIDTVLKIYAPHQKFFPPGFKEVDTLDVGDLWLILNNRSLDLIPMNWTKPTPTIMTSTVMPSPVEISTSTVDPLATVPVIKFIRKAKVTMGYGLYQFPFKQELLDRNSPQFQFYRDALCKDLANLYSNSPAFRLVYESCDLEVFATNPNSIQFNLIFKTANSDLLEGTVKDTLENSRPHFNMPGHEVILVGGMFFILKDAFVSKNVYTVTTTVLSTAAPATSTAVPSLIYDATNVYLTYEVYNMTDWIDLKKKDSALFKIYRDRACQDLNDIYKDTTGVLFLTYKDCDIDRFESNPLKSTFRLTFGQMMSDRLKDTARLTLEFKAPKKTENGHLLMKAGDMWLILNRFDISQQPTNYTAPPTPTFMPMTTQVIETSSFSSLSDSFPTISPSPTYTEMTSTKIPTTTEQPLLYDAVLANVTYLLYNFTFTEGHRDPSSYEFRKDEQLFCKDVDKVFRNVFLSPFVFTYRECRVEAFGEEPNTVRFHLIFAEKMRDELRSVIPNTLQRIAPKLNISDYEVMDLGDLYLVIGQYILSVTHHNYTRRPTIPIVFTTPPTPTTTTTLKPITPSRPTTQVFPTEWVKMQFNANLFNFTWTPELMNPDSRMFRELELAFCNDISKFFSGSMMYTAYRGCKIDSFTTNPNEINFKIGFVSPLYPGLGTDIVNIIEQNAPRLMVQDDSTLTAVMDIGGIYLVWKNFTFYIVSPGGLTSYWIPESTVTLPTTTVEPTYLLKLSFEVLNRTYTRDLANKNSAEFQRQANLFCDQISMMLTSHQFKFPDFRKCDVEAFVDNPLRVNFSLAFMGQQPEEMKARVIGIIVEGARRVNYNDLYALLIGDLTLALQGFTTQIQSYSTLEPNVTPPNIDYDGLLYNYTFYLYDGNWTQELTNPNSQLFKDTSARFCKEIDAIFKRHYLSERYYACDIEKVGNYNNKDMIVNIVLNGTLDVGDILVYDVISRNVPTTIIDGIGWLRIGDLLLYGNSTGSVRYIRFLNVPTQPPIIQTTPPEINTFLYISFDTLNLTYNSALANTNSNFFKLYATPFCNYLNRVLNTDRRFPSYDGCTVDQFTNNPVSIKFNLKFRGAQNKNLQGLITDLLIETAPRALINNQIGLVMGNLGISDRSLVVVQRAITGDPKNQPGLFTTPFPFPNKPQNNFTSRPISTQPCLGSNSIFVAHPSNCDKFYLCSNGQGVEIQCAAGTRFDPNLSVCVNKLAGFICTL